MHEHLQYRLPWNDREGKYQAADVHRMVMAAPPVPVQIDQPFQRVDKVPPKAMGTPTMQFALPCAKAVERAHAQTQRLRSSGKAAKQ